MASDPTELEAERRAEILGRVNGNRGAVPIVARVVGSEAPVGALLPVPKSRDTASVVIASRQTFFWKDLIAKTDDEMLGFIAELVELEQSRRGARR